MFTKHFFNAPPCLEKSQSRLKRDPSPYFVTNPLFLFFVKDTSFFLPEKTNFFHFSGVCSFRVNIKGAA